MAKIKNTDDIINTGKRNTYSLLEGMKSDIATLEDSFVVSDETEHILII